MLLTFHSLKKIAMSCTVLASGRASAGQVREAREVGRSMKRGEEET